MEIARASIEAINRRDLDAALTDAASNFVFDFSRAIGPQRGAYNLGEVRGFFEDFVAPWESLRWEVTEVIEVGDQVATALATRHRGRDGIEAQTLAAWVWTIRDGAVLRIAFYQDRDQALEAAGMAE